MSPAMATKIYTKTGDAGETGLFGGARVPKDDARVQAYGTVDELNAVLGVARTHDAPEPIDAVVAAVQSLLFELGGALATAPGSVSKAAVTEADVLALERHIDAGEALLPPLKTFILPGGTPLAASLHLARCVCRRAERLCVALRRLDAGVPEIIVTFLNRLSDLLFVQARLANHLEGRPDVGWQARGNQRT